MVSRIDFTNAELLDCIAATRDGDAWIKSSLQAAGIGVWSWNIASNLIEITESGWILHGLTHDAPISYRDWLMAMHMDDQEPTRRATQRALGEKNSCRIEYRVMLSEDDMRWIAIQCRARSGEAEKPLRLVGILFDITALKLAEQALKDQHQMLAHMARVSTLGELSAALAHELNQPLTATLCNALAGQRFLAQTQPNLEELGAILSDIEKDSQRAGAVVSRLIVLFKKEENVRQSLNINAIIAEVTQLLRSKFIENQILLLLNLGEDLPKIMGDPVQILQVLLNLIMNATEAMALSAGLRRQLQIRTGLFDAGNLEVVVHDTGPGIAPQMLKQIFEPFVSDKPHGLGMGLAISRTIVNSHDGRLWADTPPDGGAVLRFTLPVLKGENT